MVSNAHARRFIGGPSCGSAAQEFVRPLTSKDGSVNMLPRSVEPIFIVVSTRMEEVTSIFVSEAMIHGQSCAYVRDTSFVHEFQA